MYEHFRNALMVELSLYYDSGTIDRVMSSVDKVAADYEITDRETSLAVIDDEIPKIVKIYLSSKKLEGLSAGTIKMYANRLKTFFGYVRHNPEEIETNEIR